jgi:hypothetical protein
MKTLGRGALAVLVLSFAGACASTQLNYNALDLSGTVDDLLTNQIVYNLGRFWVDSYANPSQASIPSGSIGTTNQASASLSAPLNTAVTETNQAATAAGAVIPSITRVSTGVLASTTITPSLNNQATQSWSLSPNTDSDQERRLRALYRFATRAACKGPESISAVCKPPEQRIDSDKNELRHSLCTKAAAAATACSSSKDKETRFCKEARCEQAACQFLKKQPNAQIEIKTACELEARNEVLLKLWKNPHDDPRKKKLCAEYPLIVTQASSNSSREGGRISFKELAPGQSQDCKGDKTCISVVAYDAQFLREPGCIICSASANKGNPAASILAPLSNYCNVPDLGYMELYINPRLTSDWLQVSSDMMDVSTKSIYMGRYSGLNLCYSDPEDYRQFVLFVLEATNLGSTTGQSGKSGSTRVLPSGGPPQPALLLQ